MKKLMLISLLSGIGINAAEANTSRQHAHSLQKIGNSIALQPGALVYEGSDCSYSLQTRAAFQSKMQDLIQRRSRRLSKHKEELLRDKNGNIVELTQQEALFQACLLSERLGCVVGVAEIKK